MCLYAHIGCSSHRARERVCSAQCKKGIGTFETGYLSLSRIVARERLFYSDDTEQVFSISTIRARPLPKTSTSQHPHSPLTRKFQCLKLLVMLEAPIFPVTIDIFDQSLMAEQAAISSQLRT